MLKKASALGLVMACWLWHYRYVATCHPRPRGNMPPSPSERCKTDEQQNRLEMGEKSERIKNLRKKLKNFKIEASHASGSHVHPSFHISDPELICIIMVAVGAENVPWPCLKMTGWMCESLPSMRASRFRKRKQKKWIKVTRWFDVLQIFYIV